MAMAELKKMKVLPRRAPAPHHLKKLLFFKKYYRWVLWLSLSLYFFYSSFLFPTPTAPAAPAAGAHRPPELGIYVYDLPPSYNRDWLAADGRCRSHLFAAEVAIHEALAGSPLAVSDPAEADFFLVPVYVSCNFSTANGFPSLSHARPLLRSAVHRVSALHPFWNRSSGRDHIFVASHDYGACFHAMEDAAAADGIPEFMRNSVLLQTFGVRSPHRCQEADHVVIPPYVSPDVTEWAPRLEAVKRDIWVFFRGKMEVHPKNVSGRFYSKKVRTEIWNRFNGNRRFHLRRKRFDGYRSEIARSVFCLCPLGWAPWSPRLVESVELGCVPVVIADGIRLPFPDAVDWPSISLTVPERDVGMLESILDHVAGTNLTAIQSNLWDPAVRRALTFNLPMREGDATWQVARALEGKLDRSWRRNGGRSQSESDT
ncbi:putative glucuronosyltransferase [Iris pallida]|uniref:Glucuronosyltransferase n=1 Tax=Iris pallida TaxID=29817 RepID=A0AAX6G8S1_IRIPA|nr:putative glucuronosyltransferase [Iris pallida]